LSSGSTGNLSGVRERDLDVPRRVSKTRLAGRARSSFAASVLRRYIDVDGTSHTRALAYQTALVAISGFVGLVGLASVLNFAQMRTIVKNLAERLAPGPSGRLLQQAAAGGASGATAMVVGIGAALIAGTLAMAQVERSADRMLSLGDDRRPVPRFALALFLTISSGLLLVSGGLLVGAGRTLADGFGWEGGDRTAWEVARWPAGVLIAGVGMWLLFRAAPQRRAPGRARMAGTLMTVALWTAFTALLGVYFANSSTSSRTYGPLLAVVALLIWSALSSLALHIGFAVTAELASRSDAGRHADSAGGDAA
jgi:YihY family inner membrane protein